jgi:hypothetical protein
VYVKTFFDRAVEKHHASRKERKEKAAGKQASNGIKSSTPTGSPSQSSALPIDQSLNGDAESHIETKHQDTDNDDLESGSAHTRKRGRSPETHLSPSHTDELLPKKAKTEELETATPPPPPPPPMDPDMMDTDSPREEDRGTNGVHKEVQV